MQVHTNGGAPKLNPNNFNHNNQANQTTVTDLLTIKVDPALINLIERWFAAADPKQQQAVNQQAALLAQANITEAITYFCAKATSNTAPVAPANLPPNDHALLATPDENQSSQIFMFMVGKCEELKIPAFQANSNEAKIFTAMQNIKQPSKQQPMGYFSAAPAAGKNDKKKADDANGVNSTTTDNEFMVHDEIMTHDGTCGFQASFIAAKRFFKKVAPNDIQGERTRLAAIYGVFKSLYHNANADIGAIKAELLRLNLITQDEHDDTQLLIQGLQNKFTAQYESLTEALLDIGYADDDSNKSYRHALKFIKLTSRDDRSAVWTGNASLVDGYIAYLNTNIDQITTKIYATIGEVQMLVTTGMARMGDRKSGIAHNLVDQSTKKKQDLSVFSIMSENSDETNMYIVHYKNIFSIGLKAK